MLHQPLIISTPITHSDWMHRSSPPWGEAGVRYMLEECRKAGMRRIYWRTFNGGRTLYKSAYADPAGKWDEDSFWSPQTVGDKAIQEKFTSGMSEAQRQEVRARLDREDYADFDTLAAAVKIGHELGLEIHAWITINEDDHGWGATSRFTRANPQSRWRRRDGRAYHSQQSFAFAEVREYKLNLIRELVNNYRIDGLFLDWMRTGDVRDDPQYDAEGVADFGYESPNVESFREAFGIDPHTLPNNDAQWVAWRARPHTDFMRSVRGVVDRCDRAIPVAVMGHQPWSYRGMGDKIDGSLNGLLIDLAAWAKEGLIDSAVAAGYYRDSGNMIKATQWLRDLTGGKVDVWAYAWLSRTVKEIDADITRAREAGVSQLLLWEGDYLDNSADKSAIQRQLKTASLGA